MDEIRVESWAELQEQLFVDSWNEQLGLHRSNYAFRGRWDAAQNGPQSVEAILVALNPGLQGKVEAVPFDPGR